MTDRTQYCAGCKARQDHIEKLEADKALLREALEQIKRCKMARAAIRVIAPAVLDEATNLADGHLPLGYMSERERSYCNEHGEEIAHAIRAMKTRYEQ